MNVGNITINEKSILNTNKLPFCKGCGHHFIGLNTARALEKMNYDPLDVILVTDIGCHGIIDIAFNTHTVHGLHGRSVALGAGISFGINNPDKKIIVFIGDGGCTIGLQHILEAARLNLNMTVVVHDNFLYGMTGGQSSGLTPTGFKTVTSTKGNPFVGFDICKLAHAAGAAYVSRIIGTGDFSEQLKEAFEVKGFSLVEVLEICPSYGAKLNPKSRLQEIAKDAGREIGVWKNDRLPFTMPEDNKTDSLINKLKIIEPKYKSSVSTQLRIILSGSAGEGVQLAASIFSYAASLSGLYASQKGSYPVTVGVGFSSSEINISDKEILFHGIEIPDYVIVTSIDGLNFSKPKIEKMSSDKILLLDSSLENPKTSAKIKSVDFRKVGGKNAALFSLLYFVKNENLFDFEAILEAVRQQNLEEKVEINRLINEL